jgi:hypothetical protein
MLWFIQNILFSISLIVVIHYLYIYFETTLTAPKVKDLIHCPKQKYKSLFDTINKNLDGSQHETQSSSSSSSSSSLSLQSSSSLPDVSRDLGSIRQPEKKETNDMKSDLKLFLRGIGLKSKSKPDTAFRPSYEMS